MSLATPIHPSPRTPLAELARRAAVVPLTVEQYQHMIEGGILPEGAPVELLRGVVVQKDRSALGEETMVHNPRHALTVSLLSALVNRINSDHRHLRIQLPVGCPPDGAPEPDASIVRGGPRDYPDQLPGPGDVFSVIEAAHSSLDRDRYDKLPIYAAANVPQYVLINLQNETIEVYVDPDPAAGTYRTKSTVTRGQTIRLNLGDGEELEVAAAELLP